MKEETFGILTFHRALNYGAILQAYALQRKFKNLGYNAEIIDYRPEFNERRFEKPSVSEILKPRSLYNIIFRNGYFKFERGPFEEFINKNINLSPDVVYDENGLKIYNERYKKFIVGSDQVWNFACSEHDVNYFLPFAKNDIQRTSYAASFGVSNIKEEYEKEYTNLINGFSAISVREEDGKKIVEKLTKKKANVVLDPTFLISKVEWAMIKDDSLINKNGYVLLYLMHEDRELIRIAKKIAKEKGVEVIYISDRLIKARGVKTYSNITPSQWVGLFYNATYIITNSFHGTAFSIICEKQFSIKLIENSIANSRLKNVLKKFGLEKRCINEDRENYKRKIDYNIINHKLVILQSDSEKFIKECIIEDENAK